jgi:hypothetical protein
MSKCLFILIKMDIQTSVGFKTEVKPRRYTDTFTRF